MSHGEVEDSETCFVFRFDPFSWDLEAGWRPIDQCSIHSLGLYISIIPVL